MNDRPDDTAHPVLSNEEGLPRLFAEGRTRFCQARKGGGPIRERIDQVPSIVEDRIRHADNRLRPQLSSLKHRPQDRSLKKHRSRPRGPHAKTGHRLALKCNESHRCSYGSPNARRASEAVMRSNLATRSHELPASIAIRESRPAMSVSSSMFWRTAARASSV